jgi:hypothetical protein
MTKTIRQENRRHEQRPEVKHQETKIKQEGNYKTSKKLSRKRQEIRDRDR